MELGNAVPRGTSGREGRHHASSPRSLQYLIDAIAELQLGSAARVRALVAVGALIIGVVLLVISGVVWSGLVKPPIQFTPAFANVGWTIMPTGGLLFCAGGLRAQPSAVAPGRGELDVGMGQELFPRERARVVDGVAGATPRLLAARGAWVVYGRERGERAGWPVRRARRVLRVPRRRCCGSGLWMMPR